MKKINILEIRIDGGTQPRQEINYEVVKDYAELMRDGVVFPPVTVFFDGADYWLADGFHRYHATKTNGTASIEAIIQQGSLEDAQEYSYGANKDRGYSMSAEDNAYIVIKMLQTPRYASWSQSRIAKHVGVSAMFVSRVKSKLTIEDEPKTKKFIKDGVEKEMKVEKIGKKAKDKPTKPTKPDVQPYDENEDKIVELTDVINQLADENTVLRDKISLGQWDASDIEKMDIEETVKDLREQVRLLEIDNKALRDSRDMFQHRNAELMKTVASLKRKLQQ
jgi:hypothetical protein